MRNTKKESGQFATAATIVNLTIATDLFSSVFWLCHESFHRARALFAIETMATTILRHLLLCDCQSIRMHAQQSKANDIKKI